MICGLCNSSGESGVDPCPDCAGTGLAVCVGCNRNATMTDKAGYDICGLCERTSGDPANWEWTEGDENG
jgi:hypothetical protein